MQNVGILVLSIGVWILYCGISGIPVLDTTKAIVLDPANARTIIDTAKNEASAKSAALAALFGGLVDSAGVSGISMGDVVNPYSVWGVSDDWAAHKKRGSQGGTDYRTPVGTPVVAVRGGVVTATPNNGAGGNTVSIKHKDGYTTVFMHLSKITSKTGETVGPLTVVGLSGGAKGAAGSGSSTGAHLHVHTVTPDGAFMQWEKYLSGGK